MRVLQPFLTTALAILVVSFLKPTVKTIRHISSGCGESEGSLPFGADGSAGLTSDLMSSLVSQAQTQLDLEYSRFQLLLFSQEVTSPVSGLRENSLGSSLLPNYSSINLHQVDWTNPGTSNLTWHSFATDPQMNLTYGGTPLPTATGFSVGSAMNTSIPTVGSASIGISSNGNTVLVSSLRPASPHVVPSFKARILR
jgi:hypothetical protein